MPRVYLGLGSNIDRAAHLRNGVAALRRRFAPLALSSVYESAAVGFSGAPFYNLAVGFATEEPVESLHRLLTRIEEENGRVRGGAKFAPRTLDIDLLLYGDWIGEAGGARIPRDDILRYAFVLRPLAEIAGAERHPETGERYAALWAAFADPTQPLWPAQVAL